jgi:hypothetical protein
MSEVKILNKKTVDGWEELGVKIYFKTGLGNFNMLVSNDLFRHDQIGLGK